VRQFVSEDFLLFEEAQTVVVPRFADGVEEVRRRAVELSDVCKEYPTPWASMVLRRGAPGYELEGALKVTCDAWNVRDREIGLFWRVISFGLDSFRNPCTGFLRGQQPDFWIRLEWLSQRHLDENKAFREKKALEEEGKEMTE